MNKMSTNSYIGTRDFYPQDMRFRSYMFSMIENTLKKYAFEKISGPLLENFQIYVAKSGEEIAKKQLYVFTDKGNRKIAVRPELTPTIARMYAAQIDKLAPIQRWYSIENFMRYERPQKGRLREFHQINVDIIGVDDISADFEILHIAQKIFQTLQADTTMYEIRINHRKFINDLLVQYVGVTEDKILDIAKIIDKKDKLVKEKFELLLKENSLNGDQIQKLNLIFEFDFETSFNLIPDSSGAKELKEILILGQQIFQDKNPLKYDFSIVRGLAYYTGLVFEAYDKTPTNSRALFGGGRYDDLIDLFYQNRKISGVGFAIGDVTLESFIRDHRLIKEENLTIQKHMIAVDKDIPLVFFYTLLDNLQNMEEVFLEGMEMIMTLDFAEQKDLSNKVLDIITRNPFYYKNNDDDKIQNIKNNFNKQYNIEMYVNLNHNLKKQMQYANKANITFVWICRKLEMEKGIIKRRNMITGEEEIFDLGTFELSITN